MSFKFFLNGLRVINVASQDLKSRKIKALLVTVFFISTITIFLLIYSIYIFLNLFFVSSDLLEFENEFLKAIFEFGIVQFIIISLKFFLSFMVYFVLVLPISGIIFSMFEDRILRFQQNKYSLYQPKIRSENILLSLWYTIKFGLKLTFTNFLLLPIYFLLPGINVIILLLANGYIVGKELYSIILRKFLKKKEQVYFLKYDQGEFFFLGCIICVLSTIPIINFFVPMLSMLIFSNLFYLKWIENGKKY